MRENPTQRTPPYTYERKTNKVLYKKEILWTLQIIICVLIGLEVSYEPNVHTTKLIFIMTIFICLKHDIPNKIEDTWSKWFERK